MALPWRTLDTAPTPEGALELRQRGADEFLITIAGRVLMTSRARRSEEALATLALGCLAPRERVRVLIAGLGMAYTLRAALDVLPPRGRVTVVELSEAVVNWCRGPLAICTGAAVEDERVQVIIDDVDRVIATAAPRSYDAILLDLYEGPYDGGIPLFADAGLRRIRRSLRDGGVLAVWSEDAHPPFSERLTRTGFKPTTHRAGRGGRSHVIYLGAA